MKTLTVRYILTGLIIAFISYKVYIKLEDLNSRITALETYPKGEGPKFRELELMNEAIVQHQNSIDKDIKRVDHNQEAFHKQLNVIQQYTCLTVEIVAGKTIADKCRGGK